MIESHTRVITYRGLAAVLSVIRNNGACWGRIRCAGKQLDVETRRDHYEESDEDALDAFERASRNPKCVDDAIGWLDVEEA